MSFWQYDICHFLEADRSAVRLYQLKSLKILKSRLQLSRMSLARASTTLLRLTRTQSVPVALYHEKVS